MKTFCREIYSVKTAARDFSVTAAAVEYKKFEVTNMKTTKKILALFLSMMLLLSIVPVSMFAVSASDAIYSGTTTNGSPYTLDLVTGVLTCSGVPTAALGFRGVGMNFVADSLGNLSSMVKHIVFDDTVDSVGGLQMSKLSGYFVNIESITFTRCSDAGTCTTNYPEELKYDCKLYLPSISEIISGNGKFGRIAADCKEVYFDGELVEDFVVPDGITALGNNFGGFTFKTITIPEHVESLAQFAFTPNYLCEEVTIENPDVLTPCSIYASGTNYDTRTTNMVVNLHGTYEQWETFVKESNNGYNEWKYLQNEGKLTVNIVSGAHTHSYQLVKTVEPVCGSDGGYFYACSCGDTYVSHGEHEVDEDRLKIVSFDEKNAILSCICEKCGEAAHGWWDATIPLSDYTDGNKGVKYSFNPETGLLTLTPVSGNKRCTVSLQKLEDKGFMPYVKDIVYENGTAEEIDIYNISDPNGDPYEINSVTIPSNVRFISTDAFWNIQPKKVYIDDIGAYCGITFEDGADGNCLTELGQDLYVDGELLTDLVVPEGTEIVNSGAFAKYKNLKSVTFPENTDTIADAYAFAGTPIESVIFLNPKSFAVPDAFANCGKVGSVKCYGDEEYYWDYVEDPTLYDAVIYNPDIMMFMGSSAECEHQFGEWVITTEPTMNSAGVRTRTCSLCKATEEEAYNGKVCSAEYTPVAGLSNTFTIKVADRANMLQLMELDHGNGTGTRSFGRNSSLVEIKSYDAYGNEVDSLSRLLAYEIWTINTRLQDGTIGVRIKKRGTSKWENPDDALTFENIYPEVDSGLVSAELAETSGTKIGPVKATIVTGPEAQYVRITADDGATSTHKYTRAAADEDGNLVFNFKCYVKHEGLNTFKVEVLDVYGWKTLTTLEYNCSLK